METMSNKIDQQATRFQLLDAPYMSIKVIHAQTLFDIIYPWNNVEIPENFCRNNVEHG